VVGVRPCTWHNNVNFKLWYCVLLSDQLRAWEVHGGWVANIPTDVTDTGRKYVDLAELKKWCASMLVVMNQTTRTRIPTADACT
jgi:hypothetical protein